MIRSSFNKVFNFQFNSVNSQVVAIKFFYKDPKSKFWVKNRNFGQKSKFCSKIEILVKNQNFVQKSKFWSKIEILVKNPNCGQKSKFAKFWSWIVILVVIEISGQHFANKLAFLLNLVFVPKNQKTLVKTDVWSKIKTLVEKVLMKNCENFFSTTWALKSS